MRDEEPFDCVRMMREIRGQISREMDGMAFEQQRLWIQEQLARAPRPQRPSGLTARLRRPIPSLRVILQRTSQMADEKPLCASKPSWEPA